MVGERGKDELGELVARDRKLIEKSQDSWLQTLSDPGPQTGIYHIIPLQL